jgi:SAM-dependent methyltransferase
VTALDRDVAGLTDLAGQRGIGVVQADLEDGSPWPLPDRRFSAVVVTNYLWRPLFPHILDALNAGGVLLYATFARGNETYGRPACPAFLLEPGELLDLARRGALQVVAYEHGYVAHPRPAVRQRLCAIRADQPAPLEP